jgi:hypothetical protein
MMDPVQQAELIKEAARIDPVTGRLPEELHNPTCDHCGDTPWKVFVTLSVFGGDLLGATRRLCQACANEFLEWV